MDDRGRGSLLDKLQCAASVNSGKVNTSCDTDGRKEVVDNEPIKESPYRWNYGPELRMPLGCILARRIIERFEQHVALPRLHSMIYRISIICECRLLLSQEAGVYDIQSKGQGGRIWPRHACISMPRPRC